MQNKNTFLETIFNSPSSRYYRSIRYKSNRSSTIPAKDNATNNNKLLRTQHSFENYAKRKRTNLSLCNNTTSRKVVTLENEQEHTTINLKATYHQTWNTLMNQAEFIKKLDNKLQIQRVCLPSLIQYGPSLFTSLDPLALPIEHIKTAINELTRQLPGPLVQIQLIRGEIKNLQLKMLVELEQTQKYGMKQVSRLRNMLKRDRVNELENKMRFKRYCYQLAEEDSALTQSLEQAKVRADQLQESIFSCKPFNLSLQQNINEKEVNNYF